MQTTSAKKSLVTAEQIRRRIATIVIARHGNAAKIADGQEETRHERELARPLTERGDLQAERLGMALGRHTEIGGLDYIFASNARRSQETIVAALRVAGHSVEKDDLIILDELGIIPDANHPVNVMFNKLGYACLQSPDGTACYHGHELASHLHEWHHGMVAAIIEHLEEKDAGHADIAIGCHAVVTPGMILEIIDILDPDNTPAFSEIRSTLLTMKIGEAEAIRLYIPMNGSLEPVEMEIIKPVLVAAAVK